MCDLWRNKAHYVPGTYFAVLSHTVAERRPSSMENVDLSRSLKDWGELSKEYAVRRIIGFAFIRLH